MLSFELCVGILQAILVPPTVFSLEPAIPLKNGMLCQYMFVFIFYFKQLPLYALVILQISLLKKHYF